MSQFVQSSFSVVYPALPSASAGVASPVVNQTNLNMEYYFPNLINASTISSIGVPPQYANPSLPYALVNGTNMNNFRLFPDFVSLSTFAISSISSPIGSTVSVTVQQTNVNNASVFPQFSQ